MSQSTTAEQRESAVQFLEREMDKQLKAYENAKQQFAEKVASGKVIDHWTMESFLAVQANAKIWAPIADMLPKARENGYDIYDLVQDIANQTASKLIRDAGETSRSTSVVSNVCDDIDAQAKAEFVRNMRVYAGIKPVLELPAI